MEVDMEKSRFIWSGKKVLAGGHTGEIKIKSATLNWDKDQLQSGKIVMDLNSITVSDLQGEKQTDFLSHMKSADFFEVNQFPEAIFEISSVTPTSLKGKMTIKGKTVDTEIPYTRTDKLVKGVLNFDRTKFGLIYNSSNFFKDIVADKVIKDLVEVSFEVYLK